MKLEKSREIRQWLKMLSGWIFTGAMIDCTINEGKNVKKSVNWISNKWSGLKAKIRNRF